MERKYKDYKIYKFFTWYKGKETDKKRKAAWRKAEEKSKLTQELIEKFSGETFELINKHTVLASKNRVPYIKEWLHSTFDIGKDMMTEKTGVLFEHHWRSEYYMVPKSRPDIIAWMDSKVPDWVSIVTRV